MGLALCLEANYAIFLENAHDIQFEDLTLRFGSTDTVRLNNCSNIAFDHVRIRSGSRAVHMRVDDSRPNDKNNRISLAHCEIDGGIPTWFFRSDRKDVYLMGPVGATSATHDEVHLNTLGAATSGVQLSGTARTSNVTVHHCEIFNAHDSYVFGKGMRFHHNWVRNLNDDGIALSGEAETQNARIYGNVMTQCLTALSFAARRGVNEIYVFGNLIDIREPTLGIRPDGEGPPDALRQGHFFKNGADEGHIELFHNTCLVLDPGAKGDVLTDLNDAGFAYYATLGESMSRDAFNNIFVAIYTAAAERRPIAFLPPRTFPCSTDGNTYFRIPAGGDTERRFLVRWRVGDELKESDTFTDLSTYHQRYWPDPDDIPYEAGGLLVDPAFRSFNTSTGVPTGHDDLRLRPDSSSKGSAVPLPEFLSDMFLTAMGAVSADRGCFPDTGARLRVGVNERKVYPPMEPLPPA